MKDLIIISNFTSKPDFVLIWKQNKIQNFQARKKAEYNSNTNFSRNIMTI